MLGLLCAQDREDLAVLTGNWLLRERFWLWSKAPTFNVLVGAQPVPSIECSLSKLEQTKQSGQQILTKMNFPYFEKLLPRFLLVKN